MAKRDVKAESRRQFIKFLVGSPLLAYPGATVFGADGQTPRPKPTDPMILAPLDPEALITSPKDAINVFDFEPVCRKNTPPAHFGYMASGIDDEVTLRANREGFLKFQLRPRRLRDVSKVDMSVDFSARSLTPPSLSRQPAAICSCIQTARSRWRAPPGQATTCTSCPHRRTTRWKT